MSPQEVTEQIEAWLDNQLPETERMSFEARLQEDAALAAEVALHRDLRMAAREQGIASFRSRINSLLAAEETAISATPVTIQKNLRNKKLYVILIPIAAALVLLLSAVWFFQTRRSDQSPMELYAAAFQPPAAFNYMADRTTTPIGQSRDASDTLLNKWRVLNQAWAANNHEMSKRLALQIAQEDTILDNRRAAYFMAGVISLSQNQPALAITYLQQAEGIDLYSEDIPWYIALAHYKMALEDPAERPQAVTALRAVLAGTQPLPRHRQAEQMLKRVQ